MDGLVEKAKNGDRTAFGELVNHFYSMVYAISFSRLRNHHEAMDLTQDVLIHAMLELHQLRDASRFSGWLRQITIRMAINRILRHKIIYNDHLGSIAAKDDCLDEIFKKEIRQEIQTSLECLKPVYKDMLTAFYFDRRSLKEISIDFMVPIGTVKSRLWKARKCLREVLEDTGEKNENFNSESGRQEVSGLRGRRDAPD